MEGLTADQVSADSFDRTKYTKSIPKSGDLIEQSTPVYKLVTSDDWSLIFPLKEDAVAEYSDKTSLHVTFPTYDLDTDGDFSMFTGTDGAQYGKLDFHQYMVQFVGERYVDFEVDTERMDGGLSGKGWRQWRYWLYERSVLGVRNFIGICSCYHILFGW